jgi:EpsI family protein
MLARAYEKNGRRIGLLIAYYGRQRSGETLHSPKRCLPGAGWAIRRTGTALVALPGRTAEINDYVVENAGHAAAALYWYQSGGRVIASEYEGKIALLRDALFERRQDAALVRITFDRSQVGAGEGIRFAAELIPRVERCFTGERR